MKSQEIQLKKRQAQEDKLLKANDVAKKKINSTLEAIKALTKPSVEDEEDSESKPLLKNRRITSEKCLKSKKDQGSYSMEDICSSTS